MRLAARVVLRSYDDYTRAQWSEANVKAASNSATATSTPTSTPAGTPTPTPTAAEAKARLDALAALVGHEDSELPDRLAAFRARAPLVQRLARLTGSTGVNRLAGLHHGLDTDTAKDAHADRPADDENNNSTDPKPQDGQIHASLVSLLCRLSCNVFSVTDAELRPIGIGLYVFAAAANHSCMPTAVVTFRGSTMEMRTVVPLAAGQEVTIGYVDLCRPRRIRRLDLKDSHHFLCNCRRCGEGGDESAGAPEHCTDEDLKIESSTARLGEGCASAGIQDRLISSQSAPRRT